MSRLDEIRLMAKVARMYYDQGIRQQEITERLNIHQSKISRMLKRAREANIVRISVTTPSGFFPDLRGRVRESFSVERSSGHRLNWRGRSHRSRSRRRSCLLCRNHDQAGDSHRHLLLESVVVFDGRHAASKQRRCRRQSRADSWRRGQCQHPIPSDVARTATCRANRRITRTLAGSRSRRIAAGQSCTCERCGRPTSVPALFKARSRACRNRISRAISLLASSGNIFSAEERSQLRDSGAVGDICFQFIDKEGRLVSSPLMERVIGIDLATLQSTPRVVGIAGGESKISGDSGLPEGEVAERSNHRSTNS